MIQMLLILLDRPHNCLKNRLIMKKSRTKESKIMPTFLAQKHPRPAQRLKRKSVRTKRRIHSQATGRILKVAITTIIIIITRAAVWS